MKNAIQKGTKTSETKRFEAPNKAEKCEKDKKISITNRGRSYRFVQFSRLVRKLKRYVNRCVSVYLRSCVCVCLVSCCVKFQSS
jgi:hypothetical protein